MNSSAPRKLSPRLDRPRLSAWFAHLVLPVHKFFDALCHSKYNPLYRSGTIAVAMFLLLVISGIYLLFFYKVGAPHASMQQIVDQVWFGAFMRGVHRYATNLAIVASLLHLLQILVQGKTWGPRLLAWISGLLMIGMIYLAAWSGYVMVWDQQGQLIAEAGAKLLAALPFLRDTMNEAFAGTRPLPSSFFFMNLFMHVAVPLLFVIGLLVHTARIKRTQWLPPTRILGACLLLGLIYALWLSPPLLQEANLLRLIPRIPIDLFSGFWIPLVYMIGEQAVLCLWIVLFGIALFLPLYWKPKKNSVALASQVDALLCTGCTQCAVDCPYEAISMQPTGEGRTLVARVEDALCVSCGVCSASCDVVAIGLPAESGSDQANRVAQVVKQFSISSMVDVAIVVCGDNPGIVRAAEELNLNQNSLFIFPLNCAGTLHNLTMKELLKYAKRIVIWSCAERVCQNRDGLSLFRERLERRRVPFLDKTIDRSRISLMPRASWEKDEILAELQSHALRFSSLRLASGTLLAGILFLLLLNFGTEFKFGSDPSFGVLRIAGHIPARKKENCRPLSDEEKQRLPKHMQRPTICEEQQLEFMLRIIVDGQEVVARRLIQHGMRSDRPVYLNETLELKPGEHKIEAYLAPIGLGDFSQFKYEFIKNQLLKQGQVLLIVPDASKQSFEEIYN